MLHMGAFIHFELDIAQDLQIFVHLLQKHIYIVVWQSYLRIGITKLTIIYAHPIMQENKRGDLLNHL